MQNVPLFPKFRKFTPADQGWYNEFYKQFKPYADFSFGNLIVWLDYYDDLMVSRYKQNVIFTCTTLFMKNAKIFTFLGKEGIKETVDALFAYQVSLNQKPILAGLTQEVANGLLLNHNYLVAEDRDNYEYLYKAEKWANLEGPSVRKLRQEVGIFRRRCGNMSSTKTVDLRDINQLQHVRQFLGSQPNTYTKNDGQRDEAKILDRLFNLVRAGHAPHKCIALYIHDSLEAFLIYQPLPQLSTVIFNHVKASYNYKYMFNYLLHSAAKLVSGRGVSEINFEQDLGITGLREHKESLKPYDFIKKFTIRPS